MQTITQLANFAVLNLKDKNSDFLSGIDKLFLSLIAEKRYSKIEKDMLASDFTSFYGTKVSPIFCAEFIGRLKNSGYLRIDKYTSDCVVDYYKVDGLKLKESIFNISKKFALFLEAFKQFCNDNKFDLTEEKIEKFVLENIQNYLLKTANIDNNVSFIFDKFLKHIRYNNEELFKIYEIISLGYVYSNFLISNNVVNDKMLSLDKLTVFIDTNYAFSMLGINDLYEDKEPFIDLIRKLKKCGARIKMFHHTYLEMIDIIDGAKIWIDNINYLPSEATRATRFFIQSGYKVEQITELEETLSRKLSSLGIIVVDTDYPKAEEMETLSNFEENIKQEIISEYNNSSYFYTDVMKNETIERDARSLFYILNYRNDQAYRQIKDVNYIFLTRNAALSKVSTIINQKRYGKSKIENLIPLAVTDSFLSVLLWIVSPEYSSETNMMILIPSAFAAFDCSIEMYKKMEELLEQKFLDQEISETEMLGIKASGVTIQKIIDITNNNVNNFSLVTFELVEKRIREEEEIKANIENNKLKEENNSLVETIISKDTERIELNNKKIRKHKIVALVLFFILYLGLIACLVSFSIFLYKNNENLLNFLIFIIPTTLSLIWFAVEKIVKEIHFDFEFVMYFAIYNNDKKLKEENKKLQEEIESFSSMPKK